MLTNWADNERQQLMIVNDPGDLARYVRSRYPQFELIVSPDYLSGVAALAKSPARGLLVGVDPTNRKLKGVIGGLRKAAGASTRLVLCCLPSAEPAAKAALAAGADDYVIYPPQGQDLDQALDLPSADLNLDRMQGSAKIPSLDELTELAEVIASIDKGKKYLLDRICKLIADSMRAPSLRLIVDNDIAQTGDANFEPTLVETITSADRNIGQILVGPRQRQPYTTDEVEKLKHYGRLIGHL
ncbi:MAG: hypothetical protein ACYTBZ_04930, partial [Planctomycetota bacterium]